MKRISKYIILAALAVIPSILGGSSAKATAESDGAKTPYVIYHDNNGTVITRDAYKSGYTFDAAFPQFYTGPEYMNTGWNTKADGKGTTYKTGEKLSDLTEDLDLYPMLEKGFYVRFDSDGGTPIQYQFVFSGGKATKPTTPTRTGYTFDNWYSDEGCTAAFDFGSTVNKDMKLYAKWTPAAANYTVRIWLEKANHPIRDNAEDALKYAKDDYAFSNLFQKTGTTGGNVEFTDADRDISTVKNATEVNFGITPVKQYFYDNANSSFAKAMTELEIAKLNESGIDGDGKTILNVYYRRLTYNVMLIEEATKDGKGCVTEYGTPWKSNAFTARFGETLEQAINRNGVDIDSKFDALMKVSLSNLPYKHRTDVENCGYSIGAEHKLYSAGLTTPSAIYGSSGNKTSCVDNFKDNNNYTITFTSAIKGDNVYLRHYYYQTLESAEAGNESTIEGADRNHYFYNHKSELYRESTLLADGCALGDQTGLSLYFYQIANVDKENPKFADLTVVYKYKTSKDRADKKPPVEYYYVEGNKTLTDLGIPKDQQQLYFVIHIDGEPKKYEKVFNTLPYLNASSKDEWKDIHYVTEIFHKRNAYPLTFVTGTEKIKVASKDAFNKVCYQKPLKDLSPLVQYTDASGSHLFEVDKTTYTDDKLVVWVFKGWYDNNLFMGNPIDFATTTRTMPASNLTLYAKWERLTIEATFDGNGGKVEGKDKMKKEQQSGDIPKRPSDPVPPEGMAFSCWTINGILYDFTEPIYDNTELKALYYSNGTALKVTYDYGEGAGTVPVDSGKYLAGANPEILPPAADLVPPIGQKFSYWTDSEHHTYVPGDDFIINDDTQLTAVYADGDRIIIKKEGLKFGESAAFSVYDESEPAKVVNVILTGVDNTGSTVSQIVAVEFKTKNITVKELPWSWAYDANKDVITKDVSKDGNVFTFTNVEKENAPLRDEAIKNNAIINARYGVTVNEWEKEKRNLGK